MRSVVAVFVIASAFVVACASRTASPITPNNGLASTRDELVRREIEMKDAGLRRDASALEQIVAQEFRLSRSARPAAPRDRWFANLATMSADSYDVSNFDVHSWGEAAVVHAHHTIRNWKTGDRVNPSEYDVTDLWVKRDGRWQIVQRISNVIEEQ